MNPYIFIPVVFVGTACLTAEKRRLDVKSPSDTEVMGFNSAPTADQIMEEQDVRLNLDDSPEPQEDKVVRVGSGLVHNARLFLKQNKLPEIIYTTQTGSMYHINKKGSGAAEWSEPVETGASTRENFSVIEASDGRLFLYFLDLLNTPHYTWQKSPDAPDSWVQPVSLEGTSGALEALKLPSDEVLLFQTSLTGSIRVRRQPDLQEPGLWDKTEELNGKASILSPIYSPTGGIALFFVGIGELFWVPSWFYSNTLHISSFAGLYYIYSRGNRDLDWSNQQKIAGMVRYIKAVPEGGLISLYTISSALRIWIYRYNEEKKVHDAINTGYTGLTLIPLQDPENGKIHLIYLSLAGEIWFNGHRLGGKSTMLQAVIDCDRTVHVLYSGMITKNLYYFTFPAPQKGLPASLQ